MVFWYLIFREIKLFFKLLDLVRSPELIKMITGELDDHIAILREKQIRE